MNRFFGLDSPFFKVMTKVADFIILNFLVLVFSIPVITIGPAFTAMYYVALKEVRGQEGYLWRDFWKSFKQNFKQGFIIELIVAAAFAVLYINIITCYKWSYEGSTVGQILMFLNIGLGIICIASLIYLFPLLAQFTNEASAADDCSAADYGRPHIRGYELSAVYFLFYRAYGVCAVLYNIENFQAVYAKGGTAQGHL